MPTTASADGGLSLTQLMAKFPDGKYWDSYIGHNNPDGYTDTPCGHSFPAGTYNTTCTEFEYGRQCYGFANKCFYDVYGRLPKASEEVDNLNGVKAGDIIRYRNDSHSVFVAMVDGEYIMLGECNWDWKCGILWGRWTTKSDLQETLTYRYSAPYEMPIFNGKNGYANIGSEMNCDFGFANYKGQVRSLTYELQDLYDYDKTMQNWTFERQSDGSYKIRSDYDKKYLATTSTSPTANSGVCMQTSSNSQAQKWYLFKLDDRTYIIKSACADLVLSNFEGANNEEMRMKKCLFDDNQEFYIVANTFEMDLYENYINNKDSIFAKTILEKYPFASMTQINSCIYAMHDLANTRTDGWRQFVFKSEALDYMAKLNYDFPTVSGDFNGDGYDDVAQFTMTEGNNVNIDVMYSGGDSFVMIRNRWQSGVGWNVGMFTHRMIAGDFNGDKKDDICAFYDYGKGKCRAFVWLSTDKGFKLEWNFWLMDSGFYANNINDRVVACDVNGDGKDDLCAFYDYGKGECRAFVWQSTGSSFKMNWNYWYMKSGFDSSRINTRVVTGDYNGDKKDDICAFYDYGKGECRAFVWESTNGTFSLKWNYWYMGSGFDAKRLNGRVTAGDYNGDKKDDICAFYDYGKGELRAFVWQSTGSTLKLNWNWWYMKSGFYSDNLTGRVVSGDFNGDGKDDVGAYYCYSAGADQTKGRMFVYQSSGSNFNLKWNWYFG